MTNCICTNRALVASCVHPYCQAHVPLEMEEELTRLRSQLATAEAQNAAHVAFRDEVNALLPRPFGTTVYGAIEQLRTRPPLAIPEDVREAIEGVTDEARDRLGDNPWVREQCGIVDGWLRSLPTTPPVASEQEAKDAALGRAVRGACEMLTPDQIEAVEYVYHEDDMGTRGLRVINIAQRDILEAVAEHFRQEQKP